MRINEENYNIIYDAEKELKTSYPMIVDDETFKGWIDDDTILQIIEDLMVKQKMKPGVVNVLISYVLKVNNNKFTRGYVESVASQWCRSNIETVEDAMAVAVKEHKKIKELTKKPSTSKVSSKKEETMELPSWFDKEIEKKEISPEEQKELDNILKDF